MFDVFAQTALLILCGIVWRMLRPGGISADHLRLALTNLVYYLLLPALVLSILWRTPLGLDSVRIAVIAAGMIFLGLGLAWLSCRLCRSERATTGAILLAAAFPNATYLGLPVLEATFGPWAAGVAIQYDLFACTPLLLSLGVLLARRYGHGKSGEKIWQTLLKVPPLWAAAAALLLNFGDVTPPGFLMQWLKTLGAGVIPLMLLALGLSLTWSPEQARNLRTVVPVVLIQLLILPFAALLLGVQMGLAGDLLKAVVLEAAMPSMVIGIVLCDRFGLNTTVYATAVTLTTALALVSLPLWLQALS